MKNSKIVSNVGRLPAVLWLAALVLSLAVTVSWAAAAIPELQYGEEAQQLLNEGKNGEAAALLKEGVRAYPGSDWLRSLYGRSLFSEGRLDEAEDQFQQALEINKDNPVARMLIKEIRLTKDALKDREMNELVNLGMDKLGDLAVIAIGVWFGMLLSMMSGRLANRFARSNFQRALSGQDWDAVTDILENLVANWKKRELRTNMEMMLAKMPKEEVERIIRAYVDVQRYEDELLFFLRKMHVKRG
ncbi:tetratricopeptide repeat protein [Pseudodesulfovibrio indicus]|uniref:Tetratricopeptide repeat protein n=1 Tax=Pseudodesulfovibrio indicus TaxID=1716143 RepID=A0AA94PVX3_9BACT|nr:tetratricopeptide repeat protein [Pseudodesulfovibrio indicus]TDT91901.1 tetratricopeptide repeat protein [Pseudodesulfovibrio indicus]